jgi:cytochrome P450
MWSPLLPDQLAGLPVAGLATSAPPSRWHGALRSLGTHCRDGAWVVSRRADVAEALASPALRVSPAFDTSRPAGALLARTARFSDGADHRRRRDLAVRLLPPVRQVASTAGAQTSECLRRRLSTFDIMPMARSLPAAVLGRCMGLAAADAERAAQLAGRLCDAVSPVLSPRAEPAGDVDGPGGGMDGPGGGVDDAARELSAVMSTLGLRDEDEIAAATGILFQARDATAALIGAAVLAAAVPAAAVPAAAVPAAEGRAAADRPSAENGRDPRSPGQCVDDVLRYDAPVQCTRRTAAADSVVGGTVVPSGASVWIFVAAAETGSGLPATFGGGPHGCPGAAHATVIARQVVTVLLADGWRPVYGQRIDFEPRPNLRVPCRVLVTRR